MAEAKPLYVARESDLAALTGHWEAAKAGGTRFVRLQSPFGGGRRAIAGELLRSIQGGTDDAVLWRVVCLDQEDGIQWLIRMYGALVANLGQDVLKRGKVEMVLNAQLPSQTKRVQGWYQAFISSMKESKTDSSNGSVQLKLPQDNPLLGLVEIVSAISRKVPVVLDLQNPYVVYSVALAQFLEALHAETSESGGHILVIAHDHPGTDEDKAFYPMPLSDLYTRRPEMFETLTLDAWGADETQKFLDSKGLTGNAARLAEIAKGRPGFIAELADIFEAEGTLNTDLEGVTMASMVPMNADESELDIPDAPPEEGKRKHAGPNDIGTVTYIAALLGQAFPSNLVADLGGFERDSIDDLLDAMEDTFEEVQFSEEMQTWLYKFKRGSWRQGVMEHNDNDEGHNLARNVGSFMERFLIPRGNGFIPKVARIYAEHGAPDRASMMRALALSRDRNDVWALSHDLIKYFDEVKWPEPLVRTIYMNLLDRLAAMGNIPSAEKLYAEVQAFADAREDRDLNAWLLFTGSKIDMRRQDYYRARDRANDALTLYKGLENGRRAGDVLNHLAAIELQDGNPETALKNVNEALQVASYDGENGQKFAPPSVGAAGEHIRGLIARRQGKLDDAIKHFQNANNVAGQNGLGGLALDAGVSLGEAMLAGSRGDKTKLTQARDVLGRVTQIARQQRNAARERSACELLAQAEGGLRNFDAALQAANRTLQLTRALKFDQLLPIDLYNLGFFHFAKQKPTEALTFFTEAEKGAAGLGNHPVVKELYYFKGLAEFQTNNLAAAKTTLNKALPLAQKVNDVNKVISTHDTLAQIAQKSGETANAKQHWTTAIDLAGQANLKDARRTLRKKLEALG